MRAERTYRLEPLDNTGLFLGLGLLQCAILGSGLTLSVAAVTAGLPLVAAAAPLAVAASVAFARARGRAMWEWIPIHVAWAAALLGRRRSWTAPLSLWGSAPVDAMPPCLQGIDIVRVPWRSDQSLGAVRDRRRQTLTAVIPVAGPQFLIESTADQERYLAGWADLIGQFAAEGGPVTHLTWSDFARPSGLGQHRCWLTATDPDSNDAPSVSYQELIAAATSTAVSHDVVVTVTAAHRKLRGTKANANDADRLERTLATSTETLLRGCRAAGLIAAEPLDPAGIQVLLRNRTDPFGGLNRAGHRKPENVALERCPVPGPVVVEASWSHLRADAAFHRTWWIGTWPRLAVAPSWLEPFLSGGGMTRAMTVVLAPVPAHQSRRRIERDLVKLDSDAAIKDERGRRVDARHHRAREALLDREADLVAGHPEVAYAGLVTVSAPDLETLEEHGEILEQAARQNGMDLRVLLARQDLAWAAALPLGLAPGMVFTP